MTFSAAAQERARDFVSPRVNKTQFQQFLQKVGLEHDQRQIANIAFMDYEADLDALIRLLDERAVAVGRQTVDDSLAGKARIEAEALQKMRADVYRVYLEAGTEADFSLDMLLGSVEVLLLDRQIDAFDAARKWLHREILLKPRALGASFQDYAGDGVNVMELVEQAQADGGELAAIDPDALRSLLSQYEDALDDVLVATTSANLRGQLLRKIASIEGDDQTLRNEDAAALQRWQRLFDLNTQTVERIAAIADAHAGEEGSAAGVRFKQRFDRASFSWLYPRKLPDRQIEWMRAAETVSPDALAAAEHEYAAYVARRDSLARTAIDMMLKARYEFQTFLHAMMEAASVDERVRPGLFAELLKNSGELSTLTSSAASRIEATLDDESRSELRSAMRRPDRPVRPPPPPR